GHDAHLGRARAAVPLELVVHRTGDPDRCRRGARGCAGGRPPSRLHGRSPGARPPMREDVDSRIVAALRFHDATVGHVITTPLRVTGDGVRILRNRSSVYVITQAPGFEDYVAAFRDPTTPG